MKKVSREEFRDAQVNLAFTDSLMEKFRADQMMEDSMEMPMEQEMPSEEGTPATAVPETIPEKEEEVEDKEVEETGLLTVILDEFKELKELLIGKKEEIKKEE